MKRNVSSSWIARLFTRLSTTVNTYSRRLRGDKTPPAPPIPVIKHKPKIDGHFNLRYFAGEDFVLEPAVEAMELQSILNDAHAAGNVKVKKLIDEHRDLIKGVGKIVKADGFDIEETPGTAFALRKAVFIEMLLQTKQPVHESVLTTSIAHLKSALATKK